LPPSHSRAKLPPTNRTSDPAKDLAAKHKEEPKTDNVLFPTTELPESTEELELNIEVSTTPDSADVGRAEPEASGETKDRRQETRIPYDQRIVALGEEAARVLVGRDLSRGGMRIAATPSVAIGDVLRVALHSGAQTEPIVITARALRDDGEDGLILSFDDLSPTQAEQLEKIIECGLPVHASSEEFQDPDITNPSIVVAEMIETLSSNETNDGRPGKSLDDVLCANVESDAEIDAHLDSVFDTGESI
jgi:hypothetical protein